MQNKGKIYRGKEKNKNREKSFRKTKRNNTLNMKRKKQHLTKKKEKG